MADDYAIVEAALQTLLRALPSFVDPVQVSLGDDSILSGGYDNCAIIRPGPFATDEANAGIYGADSVMFSWGTELYLYRRYRKEASTAETTEAYVTAALKALRAAVITMMTSYPTLNNAQGVQGTSYSANEAFGYLNTAGSPNSGPVFMIQQIDITTNQVVGRSGGEF